MEIAGLASYDSSRMFPNRSYASSFILSPKVADSANCRAVCLSENERTSTISYPETTDSSGPHRRLNITSNFYLVSIKMKIKGKCAYLKGICLTLTERISSNST